MVQAIDIYYRLRDEVDAALKRLSEIHAEHMQCKKGCCSCCQNLSVCPVELHSIVEELKQSEWAKSEFDETAACGFLKEGLCTIYPFRPLICRTHGLPLAYWQEETDPPGYGVMFCKLNFKDSDRINFDSENTLNMDEVNGKLAKINTAFLEERNNPALKLTTRIELRELLEEL